MLPQMRPYTPSLYRPDSFGRYRHYPLDVRAQIPGTGYKVGRLAWAEQELNLDGSSQPQRYGNYAEVPLRGLGQSTAFSLPGLPDLTSHAASLLAQQPTVHGGDTAASRVALSRSPDNTYLWLGLGAVTLVAVGGAAWFLSRPKVRANRRGRR